MKNWIASVVWIAVFAALLAAQPASRVSAVSVEIGNRTVRLPSPDRFTDAIMHFPRVASRLIAAESPMNEVLAVQVTDEIAPALRKGATRTCRSIPRFRY